MPPTTFYGNLKHPLILIRNNMFKDFSNEQTLLQRDLFREPEHFLGAMKAGREEKSSVDFVPRFMMPQISWLIVGLGSGGLDSWNPRN